MKLQKAKLFFCEFRKSSGPFNVNLVNSCLFEPHLQTMISSPVILASTLTPGKLICSHLFSAAAFQQTQEKMYQEQNIDSAHIITCCCYIFTSPVEASWLFVQPVLQTSFPKTLLVFYTVLHFYFSLPLPVLMAPFPGPALGECGLHAAICH